MKIVLTGASGVGKTTMMNQPIFDRLTHITEVARNLKKERGIELNELGGPQTQTLIFNEYLRLFKENDNYVSDRGLFDVISYTLANIHIAKDAALKKELTAIYTQQRLALRKFIDENPDVIYIFVPIMFKTEDDGVRSMDEEYRKLTEQYMLYHIETSGVRYLRISGELEERMKQIATYLEHVNDPVEVTVKTKRKKSKKS